MKRSFSKNNGQDVLLVMPPVKAKWDDGDRQRYPTTLLFLADHLYRNGYRSRIIDCNANDHSVEEYIRILSRMTPPMVVGFTCCTENRMVAYRMIRRTKMIFPQVKIVVGGPHFSPTAEEALCRIPEIDVVVIGDGEAALVDLVAAFRSEAPISHIPGIAYRDGDHVKATKPCRLSTLPVIGADYHLFIEDTGRHTPFLDARNAPGEVALPVFASVGCRYHCVYCNYSHRPQLRVKPAEDLVQEVSVCQSKYNHHRFQLVAADFLMDRNYVKDVCREMKRLEQIPAWWTMGRANADPSILQTMKEAGCYNMEFSLESGSPRVLKAIRKALRFENVLEYAKECHRLGIKCSVFVMVSLPEEKEEDFAMTREAMKRLQPYVTNFLVDYTVIYPGTELEKRARERGIIPPDFSWYEAPLEEDEGEEIPHYLEHFTPRQVQDYCRELRMIGKG